MLTLKGGTIRGEDWNEYKDVSWELEDEDHQIVVYNEEDETELFIIDVDVLYAISNSLFEHRDILEKKKLEQLKDGTYQSDPY